MGSGVKRILIFYPGSFSRGGMERYLLNYQAAIDKTKFQFDYLVSEGPGLYYDEIVQMGGRVFPLLTSRIVSTFKVLRNLHKQGYEVIHFHADDLAVKAMILAKMAGFKVLISHSHNNSSFSKQARFIGAFKRFIVSNISKYRLAVSNDAGRWLFGSKPFEVMEPCLPMDNYFFSKENRDSIRKKYKIASDDLVIGCVGHLMESHKNQSYLFGVLHEVQRKRPNSWLLLVGGGFDEEKMKESVKNLGVPNVVFAGNVDAAEYYSAFDAFSLPSIHEGLGIAALEAICNGLYCVNSTNVPLAEGLEAYERRLSLEADTKSWADALIDAAERRSILCPKEYFEGPYFPENAVKKIERFYNTVFKKL